MWENIAGVKRYSRRRGFNVAGASAPAVLTPLLQRVDKASVNARESVPLSRYRSVYPIVQYVRQINLRHSIKRNMLLFFVVSEPEHSHNGVQKRTRAVSTLKLVIVD